MATIDDVTNVLIGVVPDADLFKGTVFGADSLIDMVPGLLERGAVLGKVDDRFYFIKRDGTLYSDSAFLTQAEVDEAGIEIYSDFKKFLDKK